MTWNWKEHRKQKHLFKSYYCAGCNQIKNCGQLNPEYCCSCIYEIEQEKAQEYNSYEEVLTSKQIDRERILRQLQLLRSYLGCPQCRSKAVDAYYLYEKNRLVCQPCLMGREGGSSSPISFSERSKWFKKYWGINLKEWLDYGCLPVNAECAREWLKDKGHLRNCQCLELEAQKLVAIFSSSLKRCEEKLKECVCEKSEKVRVRSDYYAWCERCEGSIGVASKKRVIKNRNDARFWGLEVEEKVLCGNCLANLIEQMPVSKKYTFKKYVKRGCV